MAVSTTDFDAIIIGLASPDEIRKWSPGPRESMAFIIPGASGGTSDEKYSGNTFPALKDQKLPLYWGNMEFSE